MDSKVIGIAEFHKILDSRDIPVFISALRSLNIHFQELDDEGATVRAFVEEFQDFEQIFAYFNVYVRMKKPAQINICLKFLHYIVITIANHLPDLKKQGENIISKLMARKQIIFERVFVKNVDSRVYVPSLKLFSAGVLLSEDAAFSIVDNVCWESFGVSIAKTDKILDLDSRFWTIFFFTSVLHVKRQETLEKYLSSGALSFLLAQLRHCQSEQVIKLLEIIKEKVLLNTSVSKQLKAQNFNNITLKPLFMFKELSDDQEEATSNLKEGESDSSSPVREAILSFLKVLCSSDQFGIFHSKTSSYQPSNGHVIEIIEGFSKHVGCTSSSFKSLLKNLIAVDLQFLGVYVSLMQKQYSSFTDIKMYNFIQCLNFLVVHINVQTLADEDAKQCISLLIPEPINAAFISRKINAGVSTETENELLALVQNLYQVISKVALQARELSQNRKSDDLLQFGKEFVMKSIPNASFLMSHWSKVKDLKNSSMLNNLVKLLSIISNNIQELKEQLGYGNIENILNDVHNITSGESNHGLLMLSTGLLKNPLLKCETTKKDDDVSSALTHIDVLNSLFQPYINAKESELTEENLNCFKEILMSHGLTESEADIRLWLSCLDSKNSLRFLCDSIIHAVNNIDRYYDQVVVITSNATIGDSARNASTLISATTKDLELSDNSDIFPAVVPLSFSRLVLACIDMLEANTYPEPPIFFSNVMKKYLHEIAEPCLLAQHLVSKDHILNDDLMNYCKYWTEGKASAEATIEVDSTVSDKITYIFLSKKYKQVDKLIEEIQMPNSLDSAECLVKRLLLYLHVETSDNRTSNKKKCVNAYIKLLKAVLKNIVNNGYLQHLTRLILNHAAIFNQYDACHGNVYTSFVDDLLKSLDESSHGVLLNYFKQSCLQLKLKLSSDSILEDELDFWNHFSIYFNQENFLKSKGMEIVTKLFLNMLEAPKTFFSCASFMQLGISVGKYMELIDQNNQSQVYSCIWTHMNNYFDNNIIYNSSSEQSGSFEFYKILTRLLSKFMTSDDIERIQKSDIQWLVSCSTQLGSDVILNILNEKPSHLHLVVKTLKKSNCLLPGAAALVRHILQNPDSDQVLCDNLNQKLKEPTLDWLQSNESQYEQEYLFFLEHLLKNNVITHLEVFSSIKTICKKVLVDGDRVPQHIVAVCHMCETLKGHKKEAKVPGGDALLCSLHLLLTAVIQLYHEVHDDEEEEKNNSDEVLKSNEPTQLLTDVTEHIKQLLQKLSRRTRPDKVNPDIWNKFIANVLSTSLKDSTALGPMMISCLRQVCEFNCCQGTTDYDANVLEVHTLLISHPHYDTLMLSSKKSSRFQLKESVAQLHLSLVRLHPPVSANLSVCKVLAYYSATTRPHDQALLQVLQEYQKIGALLVDPVVWGSAAEQHFAIQNDMPIYGTPHWSKILSAVQDHMLMRTCIHFDRNMAAEAHIPCKLQPDDSEPIYDLRYLLLVFGFIADKIFFEKSVPADHDTAKILCLTVASLSAKDSTLRSIAIGILRTMRSVYDFCKADKQRTFWQWLIDIVCYTLAELAQKVVKSNVTINKRTGNKNVSSDNMDETGVPLSGPLTRFLIEAILAAAHCSHPLYHKLLNYVFLFPTMKSSQVPEMLRLFNDSQPETVVHSRLLLLKLISEGITTEEDCRMVMRSSVLPLVFSLTQSPSATPQLKIESLRAIQTVASTYFGCNKLVRHMELLQLLPLILDTAYLSHDDRTAEGITAALMALVTTIWKTLVQYSERSRTSIENGVGDTYAPTENVHQQQALNEDAGADNEHFDEEWNYGENGEYYNGDEGYYEEEFSDDEEKAKLRKKRKLEAKNRKAAKKRKLEESAHVEENVNSIVTSKTIPSKTINIDSLLLCDLVQCLYSIAVRVYKLKDLRQSFDDIIVWLESTIKNRVKVDDKISGEHLMSTFRCLKEQVTVLQSEL